MTAGPVLLAVAHGSRHPGAARVVENLLAAVRRRRPCLRVQAAYLDHAQPSVPEAVAALRERAVAVPLLLTAAFHTDTDLPLRLRAARVSVSQAEALGPHPLLLEALERRLTEVGVRPSDPGTAVVLAAAGSSNPRAVATVRELARTWSRAGWRDVVPAFAAGASPSPAEAVETLRRCGADHVAVASYLLVPGQFAQRLHDSGADVVSPPLGAAPEVVSVVLERYDASLALPAATRAGPTVEDPWPTTVTPTCAPRMPRSPASSTPRGCASATRCG